MWKKPNLITKELKFFLVKTLWCGGLCRVLGSNLKTSPTTNLTGQSNIALIKKVAEHFFKDKLVTCPFIQEELVGNLLYCWNEPIFLRIDDKQLYLGV